MNGKRPSVPAGRRWWLAAAAAGILALGAVGWLWSPVTAALRVRAKLPAAPDVSKLPAALGAALRDAGDRARALRHAAGGVADLGRLYHANGCLKEAEACWRILVELQPAEPRWPHYLADLRRSAGDAAEVTALLQRTVALAPDYAPAWLDLAELEFKTGQLDAAERDYRRRLVLLPGDPYARLGLARVALQHEHREEGKRLLAEIVRDTPSFPPAQNLYAEMLAADGDKEGERKHRWLGRMAGRFREATDPWLEELNGWCFDPDRLAVLAAVEYQTSHGDRGKSLLARVIQLAPEDSRGYLELGKIHLNLGDPAGARELFEQAMKLPNPSSSLFVNLSQAYRELHQPDEALRVADRGLAVMPDAFDILNARGIALQTAGRLDEAVAAYRQAVAHATNVFEPNFNLGLTLLQLGRRDEAYACLKRAQEAEPTSPRALAVLGQFELDAGRLEEAAQYLRPFLEFYPGMNSSRRLMAQWHLQAGMVAIRERRLDEAGTHFRDGLTIDPGLAELHGRLGLLCAQQRRLPEALEQLETFRRLQPNNPRAAQFLGEVCADAGRLDDARRMLAEGETLARRAGDTATAAACAEALGRLPR